MFWRFLSKQSRQSRHAAIAAREGHGLQIVLWALWSAVVIGIGYVSWHSNFAAHQPINTPGLVIHCVVGGLIGLVAMTWLEMRLQPWRFL